jgi:indolepyruvate decarboxylase
MQLISVCEYLLVRLAELGISDIIGVPGDFNLGIVEKIEHDDRFRFISECNELNASYAADGYARTHGISALITTYGPGELSAVNGIAGAYAERVPVIKITGGIALSKIEKKLPLHHTLLNGKYDQSLKIYEQITCAQGLITFDKPGEQMDRLINACIRHKQPVYMQIPQDVALHLISAPTAKIKLNVNEPLTDPEAKGVDLIHQKLVNAKNPLIIVGDLIDRYNLGQQLESFLTKTGIPFVLSWAVKGLIREELSNYGGVYAGEFSLPQVREFVESSDCIISLGMFNCEINLGEFSANLPQDKFIDIQLDSTTYNNEAFTITNFTSVITAIAKLQINRRFNEISHNPNYQTSTNLPVNTILHDHIIDRAGKFLAENDTLILETGTISFTAGYYKVPAKVKVISSVNWYSIGYALAATSGVALAKKAGRTLLITGDGSLQMSVQAISTMLRYNLKPVILILNNEGYTIERAFLGENSSYNDVQVWNYTSLADSFGGNAYTKTVTNATELEQVLNQAKQQTDKMWLIEVKMGKYEYPSALLKLAELVVKQRESQEK